MDALKRLEYRGYDSAGASAGCAISRRGSPPRLRGAFALAFLFKGEEDLLIGARKGSPLAIGYGEGKMFLGSDAIALAPVTDAISCIEEGDSAVLTRNGVEPATVTPRLCDTCAAHRLSHGRRHGQGRRSAA